MTEWIRGQFAQMTSNDRWTAGVLMTIVVSLVAFGAPTRLVGAPVTDGRTAAAPATTSPSTISTAAPAVPTNAAPPAEAPPVTVSGARPSPPLPARRIAPKVVALVADDTGNPTVPTDAETARQFLGAGTATVSITDSDACAQIPAGALAVAADDVPDDLASCITGTGASLLAFDAHTRVGPTATSMRRPLTVSVDDLVTGLGNTLRNKRVGLVLSASLQADRDAVIEGLQRTGGTVATSMTIDDSEVDATAIGAGVLDFAGEGVDVVVFAASVATQSAWAAQQSAVLPAVAYAVVDVRDAVVDETYPPVFDGARTVTARRADWWTRHHGPNDEQRRCRSAYTSTLAVPELARPVDIARAAVWCQASALLRLAAASPSGPLLERVRSLSYDSPVTFPLAPVLELWGPNAVASLTWSADCACWAEDS